MRAYETIDGNNLAALAIVERPDPSPGPGQVVVDVRACSSGSSSPARTTKSLRGRSSSEPITGSTIAPTPNGTSRF